MVIFVFSMENFRSFGLVIRGFCGRKGYIFRARVGFLGRFGLVYKFNI